MADHGEAVANLKNLVALAGTERVSGYTSNRGGKEVHVKAYTRSPGDMKNSELWEEAKALRTGQSGLSPEQARNRQAMVIKEIASRQRSGKWSVSADIDRSGSLQAAESAGKANSGSAPGGKPKFFKSDAPNPKKPSSGSLQADSAGKPSSSSAPGGKPKSFKSGGSNKAIEDAFETINKLSSHGGYDARTQKDLAKAKKAHDAGDDAALNSALDSISSRFSQNHYDERVQKAVDTLRDKGEQKSPETFLDRMAKDGTQQKHIKGFLKSVDPQKLETALDILSKIPRNADYGVEFNANQKALNAVLGEFKGKKGVGPGGAISDDILEELLKRLQNRPKGRVGLSSPAILNLKRKAKK